MSECCWACSILPEDEWFADVAEIAIKMLTGNDTFANEEEEYVGSPTASQSAE